MSTHPGKITGEASSHEPARTGADTATPMPRPPGPRPRAAGPEPPRALERLGEPARERGGQVHRVLGLVVDIHRAARLREHPVGDGGARDAHAVVSEAEAP